MDKGSKFLSDLVFSRTYAKTKPNGFKETYEETVDRVLNMHCAKFPEHAEWIRGVCRQPMVDKWVVPSMRTMQFAGGGVERENFRGFNCSALAIDSFRAFAELFYVLMAGTGVGYSVQDHHVTELPIIPEKGRFETFKIPDSREGWCDSVLKLFENPMCVFDYSAIRPAGSLISSGGTASGPDALMLMHEKVSDILLEAGGRQLTPEEASDIVCHIADAVVVGGVRRSALICLFDSENMLTYKSGNWWEKNPQRGRANVSFVMKRDELKRAQFDDVLDKCFASFAGEPGVFLTNNKDMLTNPCVPYETVILTQDGPRQIGECVDQEIEIWNGFRWVLTTPRVTGENKLLVTVTLQDGRSLKCTLNHKFVLNNNINFPALSLLPGDVLLQSYLPDGSTVEGGVVKSVNYAGEEAKVYCFTDEVDGLGMFNGITTKQCAEISLKSQGLCNLSEINWGILHTKTDDEILKAINVAIVLGVLQATYTDFGYVDPKWKENAVDEALLGVSITGQAENFQRLKEFLSKHSLTPNLEGISKRFGIRQPKRVYTVKPSGSTSALLGCTSGIHAAHSNYYIRRVRVDKAHPVAKYLETIPEMTQFLETDKFTPSNYVISMPICKEGAITRAQETAVELMERAKFIKQNWIDVGHREGDNTHNVSLTVSYKPEEEAEVKQWMWENREIYNGISLLPYDGGTYVQAPFEEIDKETYERLIAVFPDIDLNSVNYGGTVDERVGESACAGGNCEVT